MITVFARTDYDGPALTDLVDIINHVKPTALLGLSTIRVRLLVIVVFCIISLRSRMHSLRKLSKRCVR